MNAHNMSPRIRRMKHLEAPLSTFRDCDLEITCGNCRRPVKVPISDIRPAWHDKTLSEVMQRLRCRLPNCGGMPSALVITRGTHRMPILGPEMEMGR